MSWPHSTVPWLQRQLLPTAVMEPSQDESAVRDRVIDGVLVLVAAVLGAVSLASSWAGRDAWSLWLDVGLGSVACAALALRRRHPTAVAVLALAATTVSPLAGFAALVALFNAAVRSSPRALAWIFALSLVSNAIYPLLYADARPRRLLGHDGPLRARDDGRDRLGTVRANATGAGCVAARTRSAARVRAAAAGRAGARRRAPADRAGDARRARAPSLAPESPRGRARVQTRRLA